MIETILIGATCLAAGSVVGYLLRKQKKPMQRCESLHVVDVVDPSNKRKKSEKTVRCELELFHAGPHHYTIGKSFKYAGDSLWWENKDSLSSLIK